MSGFGEIQRQSLACFEADLWVVTSKLGGRGRPVPDWATRGSRGAIAADFLLSASRTRTTMLAVNVTPHATLLFSRSKSLAHCMRRARHTTGGPHFSVIRPRQASAKMNESVQGFVKRRTAYLDLWSAYASLHLQVCE